MKHLFITSALLLALPGHAFANGGKTASSILDTIDASLAEEYTALAKKPSGLDYNITQTSFRAGGKGGTRFFFNSSDNKIVKDTSTRKFSTNVRSKEYGLIIAARAASLPKQRIEFGLARKEIHTATYNDLTWMPVAGAWNTDVVGQAKVTSSPIYFSYIREISPATDLSFSLTSQKLKLDTPGNLTLRNTVYTIAAAHKTKSMDYTISIARIKPQSLSGNTHIRASAARALTKNASATLTAGMYTRGAPTAGGPFSAVGEQFVFSYLGGISAFDPVFTSKIGYFSLGVNIHTK